MSQPASRYHDAESTAFVVVPALRRLIAKPKRADAVHNQETHNIPNSEQLQATKLELANASPMVSHLTRELRDVRVQIAEARRALAISRGLLAKFDSTPESGGGEVRLSVPPQNKAGV